MSAVNSDDALLVVDTETDGDVVNVGPKNCVMDLIPDVTDEVSSTRGTKQLEIANDGIEKKIVFRRLE